MITNTAMLTNNALEFFSLYDTPAAKEEDKTLSLYEGSIAAMQQQITSLADKNRDLRSQLITVESRHRELEVLRRAEISALEEKVKTSEGAVEAMRKEMQDALEKAHKMVQAALNEKEVAVQTATKLADERVAAARQETETQMKQQRLALLNQIKAIANTIDSHIQSEVNWYSNNKKHSYTAEFEASYIKGRVDPETAKLRGLT